jgi:hypothetical protein
MKPPASVQVAKCLTFLLSRARRKVVNIKRHPKAAPINRKNTKKTINTKEAGPSIFLLLNI